MKWSPAVGAAAEPASLGVDGLVALGIGERLVDVRRQRHLAGRLPLEPDEPAAAAEGLHQLDRAEPLACAAGAASGGRAPPRPSPQRSTSSTSRAAARARRGRSRAGMTRVSLTTTSASPS